jgi:3-oxoacyl-[acyl-carrier protein] reductase
MQFEGKVALVTGGSRGIGKAIVDLLVLQGAKVYYTFKNTPADSESIQERINLCPLQCDVTHFEDVKKTIEKIYSENKTIDFLVNNAGITRDKLFGFIEQNEWKDVIDTNLNGTYNTTRCVIIKMMKKKFGRIVNIVSVAGLIGIPYQTNYCASKAGIIGFTQSLAKEIAGIGITVNAVAAGYVDTEMTKKMPEKLKVKALENIPMKRFAKPEEIAFLVSFLLSDKADYITGSVIKIDGGII